MNPLLSREFLIPFGAIRPEHVEPGVKAALSDAEAALERLRRDHDPPTYANTLGALEALTEPLGRVVTIAAHLSSVQNSPEMRAAYNAVVPLYRAFYARLPLDAGLWAR
jgi:oligopeptidase A